ncbi:TetR/AcrR family transcriptional regulator, partial [Solidesulfovibrio sp.]
AICDRLVRHIELRCRESIVRDETSTDRIKRFILEYHKTIMVNIIKEKRLYDMVSVAMDEHWPVIQEHSERMMDSLRIIIERGISLGEFRNNNAVETTKTVYQAIAYFIYPSLIEHAVNDAKNNEQAHSMEEDLKQLLDLILNGLRSGV